MASGGFPRFPPFRRPPRMTQFRSGSAPGAPPRAAASRVAARVDTLWAAAHSMLPALEAGRPIDAAQLRSAMTDAFGASDSEGAWDWKSAYDACEVAEILFLRRYGQAIDRKSVV